MSVPDRLREAFHHAPNSEIARQLEMSDAAISNYMTGRLPPISTLIKISELTGCSIHWLATGQGPKHVDEARAVETTPPAQAGVEHNDYFSDQERRAIYRLAAESHLAPDEKVRELVLVALLSRGLVSLRDITPAPPETTGGAGRKKTPASKRRA